MPFTAQQQREYRAKRKALGIPCPSGPSGPSGKSGKSGKAKYKQHAELLQRQLAKLAQKKFVAWDSEGVNRQLISGEEHCTAFLANSMGDELCYEEGLTENMLPHSYLIPFLYKSFCKYPNHVHAWFSASYDWTMILRGIDNVEKLTELYTNGKKLRGVIVRCDSDQYELTILHRRKLRIRKIKEWPERQRPQFETISANFVDVFGFYQQSFVSAIKNNLGENYHDLPIILKGKQARGCENYLSEETKDYCRAELRALVKLCEKLRDELIACEIPVRNFWGAGSIAQAILMSHGMKEHLNPNNDEIPLEWRQDKSAFKSYNPKRMALEINAFKNPENPSHFMLGDALAHAFAGARIEMLSYGTAKRGDNQPAIHDYDLNSCYPFFMSQLPSFKKDSGAWVHKKYPKHSHALDYLESISDYSVLLVDYTGKHRQRFYPLFHRATDGSIHFPRLTSGWHHKAEILAAYNAGEYSADTIILFESWEWIPANDNRAWQDFIISLYQKRKSLQQQYGKGGAEKVLKLGINSLYGKTAQQVGYKIIDDEVRLPAYADLFIAGYITANARAKLFSLAARNPKAVISFATDGVTANEPLTLYPHECGDDLGQWDYARYEWGQFLQAGIYNLFNNVRTKQHKIMTRGFGLPPKPDGNGYFTPYEWAAYIDGLWNEGIESVTIKQDCFYTLGLALARKEPLKKLGQWEKLERTIQLTCLGRKRIAYGTKKNPSVKLVDTRPNPEIELTAGRLLACQSFSKLVLLPHLNCPHWSWPSLSKWLDELNKNEADILYHMQEVAETVADMKGHIFDSAI